MQVTLSITQNGATSLHRCWLKSDGKTYQTLAFGMVFDVVLDDEKICAGYGDATQLPGA